MREKSTRARTQVQDPSGGGRVAVEEPGSQFTEQTSLGGSLVPLPFTGDPVFVETLEPSARVAVSVSAILGRGAGRMGGTRPWAFYFPPRTGSTTRPFLDRKPPSPLS